MLPDMWRAPDMPPVLGRTQMMLNRPLTAAAAAALVLLPTPAHAAPAPGPCTAPQRYAAEAGAELLHVAALDARPLGVEHEPVKDVQVAATRTGMVAQSPVSSAAATLRSC